MRKAAVGLIVVVAVVAGVMYVAGAFDGDNKKITPVSPSPRRSTEEEPSEPSGCGDTVQFAPTYLPEGWVAELQPEEGGGGEFRGVLGHYGNEAQPGTTEKAMGGFADLIIKERPYNQGNTEPITVLGHQATLGDIHEGYSVEFTVESCKYFLIAFGVDRGELRRFAEGLQRSEV